MQPSYAKVSLLSLSILDDRDNSKLLDQSSTTTDPRDISDNAKNKLTSSIQIRTESDEFTDRTKSRNLSLSVDKVATNTILL